MDTILGSFSSPDIGTYGYKHTDKSGQTGEQCTDGKTDGGLHPKGGKQRDEHDHTDNGNDRVLTLHVGTGPFLNRCGDLTHPIISLGQPQNPLC